MRNEKSDNRPAFQKRLNHVRVTVWRNHTTDGLWFNTSITRRYQDGDVWKDATTFNGLADLALVAEAIRLARDFIAREEDEASVPEDGSSSELL